MRRAMPVWLRKASAQSSDTRGLRAGYRSGLEEKLAQQIRVAGHVVRFEETKLVYVIPAKEHKYTADFFLDNGIIIEGKGIFDAQDRAKHLYIKAQYPELDIRFVFSRASAPITKGSKTTLADWCIKYGYRYAEKVIPPEWFREAGPMRKPEAVLADGPFGFAKKDKK